MAPTAPVVAACTAMISLEISSVALAVCTASDLTSDATTAKPLPASPARAASMVALSASRLVWPAMARISLITSPIFCAACASVAICRWCPALRPTAARTISVVIDKLAADFADRAGKFVGGGRGNLAHSLKLRWKPLPRFRRSSRFGRNCRTSVVAVARMAMAPSVTVRSRSSTRRRKLAIACSIDARCAACSCIEARSRSAPRRSVISSCVATQPPPGIG